MSEITPINTPIPVAQHQQEQTSSHTLYSLEGRKGETEPAGNTRLPQGKKMGFFARMAERRAERRDQKEIEILKKPTVSRAGYMEKFRVHRAQRDRANRDRVSMGGPSRLSRILTAIKHFPSNLIAGIVSDQNRRTEIRNAKIVRLPQAPKLATLFVSAQKKTMKRIVEYAPQLKNLTKEQKQEYSEHIDFLNTIFHNKKYLKGKELSPKEVSQIITHLKAIDDLFDIHDAPDLKPLSSR